jgi:4-diphosphocytidyl-2-C-methyl-D-erythritol kinase
VKRNPPRRIEAWGAAKVNIGWRVGERRTDGYHEVCGLLHTISLCDRVEIETSEQGPPGIALTVPGDDSLEGPSNLVLKAAGVLERHADARSTTIVVRKSIPVAAGLGGGSADAAAALIGLNAAWAAGLSARELLDLGAEIGSDVPAILLGGLVHASGRGERVRNVGAFSDGWFVLGMDDAQLSASQTYDAVDGVARCKNHAIHHNDLEAAALSLLPRLAERVEVMRKAAGVAFVSGSGPSVVGVVADESHARDVAERVREHFALVELAQPIPWGVRLTVGADREP